MYSYYINSKWFNRNTTPEQLAANFQNTITRLEALNPSIDGWYMIANDDPDDPYKQTTFSAVHDDLVTYVDLCANRDDWDQPAPDWYGYSIHATAELNLDRPNGPRLPTISVCAGAKHGNNFDYEIGGGGNPPDPNAVSFLGYKDVLDLIFSVWRPAWAIAICSRWGGNPPIQPGDPPFPGKVKQMPWFIYLSPEKAAGVDAPSYVQTERAPDGGLILIAADTRFEPLNPDHMRGSRALAEILLALGIWKASSR